MTESSSNDMTVDILGKSFQVSFTDSEKENLLRAVDHLNKRVQETKNKHRSSSNESVLLITALNLTDELLSNRRLMESQSTAVNRQLKSISQKLSGICSSRKSSDAAITDFGTTL